MEINLKHMRYHYTLIKISSVGEEVEYLEISNIADGLYLDTKTFGRFLHKVKIRHSIWSRVYFRKMKTYVHTMICIWIFIAVLYIKVTNWKQPKCSPTNKWLKNFWYISPMGYLSKPKEWILIYATALMKF